MDILESGVGENVLIRYENGFFWDEETNEEYILVKKEVAYELLEARAKQVGGGNIPLRDDGMDW